MKKILTSIIVVLAVFLIYLGFRDEDVYYLSIGDYLSNGINPYGTKDYGYSDYVKDYLNENDKLEVYVNYSNENKRTIDIIKDIEDNIKIDVNGKKKTMQNALIKADLVTLSIGMNDLINNVLFNSDFSINDLYNKLEQVSSDYEELFKIMRSYCKEEIVLIGLYNTTGNNELDEFFDYANKKISVLANSYGIDYVSIYDEFKSNEYFVNNKIYPNKLGYEVIFDKIVNIIDEKIMKD